MIRDAAASDSLGHPLGPDFPSVTVVVFNDYSCGFCQELHSQLAVLRERYPQHLGVLIRNIASEDSPRFRIALGAECAAHQDTFSEYHQSAFTRPERLGWSTGWVQIAEEAGVPEMDEFVSCVNNREFVERIRGNLSAFNRLGFHGTPAIVVGGVPIEGLPSEGSLDSLVGMNLREGRR